jgi:hypothetical protein
MSKSACEKLSELLSKEEYYNLVSNKKPVDLNLPLEIRLEQAMKKMAKELEIAELVFPCKCEREAIEREEK